MTQTTFGLDRVDEERPAATPVVVTLLLLVATGGAIDLILDAPSDWRSVHVIVEATLMIASLGTAVWLWRGWRRATSSLAELRREAVERQERLLAERDDWQRSAGNALEALGQAVDRQFDQWALTPTEREVAFLLLEGHGHKQAAALTGRSERTVRQHAVSVYRKAGVSSRADLAGFFLGGLLQHAKRPPVTRS